MKTPLVAALLVLASTHCGSAADRALDAGRHPAETLAFFRVRPGQRVAELFAGGGYTAELLARAAFEEAERTCRAQYPGCGCPARPPTDDDDRSSLTGMFDARCAAGECRTVAR